MSGAADSVRADAETNRAAGKPVCLCHCGADAIGTDDEGRWACGLHIETTRGQAA